MTVSDLQDVLVILSDFVKHRLNTLTDETLIKQDI